MTDAEILVRVELSVGEYAVIRSAYKTEINGAVMEYLLTDKVRITRFKTAFKRAITDNFQYAFDQGYQDGGGKVEEMEQADRDWLTAKINAEFGYCDELFQQLRAFKADPDTTTADYETEAEKRSENYAKTLDGVYSQGKIRGAKDIMLTFGGPDGAESCKTCQKLKGQRHKKSWWIRHGLTIYRGNRAYECGCWVCEHYLYDDNGKVYTL